jgi:hydroxyacylglutathione hydrolase
VIIRSLTVGPLQENCWLALDEETRDAVLIDPGEEGARLLEAIDEEGATLRAIWLTHAHFDHIGAVAHIQRERPVPVWLHPLDRALYDNANDAASRFGLSVDPPMAPDHELNEGDALTIGSHAFTVLHLPGHAPGHVGFYGGGVLFGGDCLFAGSVGRTDLPYANPAAFELTLARIADLPDNTRVLPGHGPATTIARERAENPYLRRLALR